jgi:ABC-2 type transport system ATP-binding protein
MIKINNLSKTFNKRTLVALNSVCCEIKRGTMVGFIGPDGAGKTTLLRIVAGIMNQDSGSICYFGNSDFPVEELHKVMAYMPQKFGLYEDLTVIENLDLFATIQNIPIFKRDEAFEHVLSITRLKNFQNRLTGNLSGGMKQKLSLACSLLKKPEILILDEPSVGVDPTSRKELIGMVDSMLEQKTTIFWSTAYLDEAGDFDHVILLDQGRIIFDGNPEDAIRSIESRVFIIKDVQGNKRSVAAQLLRQDDVIDAIVQGQNIRFITKTARRRPDGAERIQATFEDACIDMLGGVTTKESAIESYMHNLDWTGGESVIEAINLTKKFGNFIAANNISFSVKRGEIFGLLGPNGSGKSTTFKMLCGLLLPTSGTARIVGTDISDIGSNAKRNIGYMAQKFSLYSTLSIVQNLRFFAGAYELNGKERDTAVDCMLEIFHMQDIANINTNVLSLGFKQRLALACAIMHKPQILFLDEPTSGVDPITRKEFWLHINCMVRHGISIVVTTHFMDEVENCDEIAIVYNGKIRAIGTPDKIKSMCNAVENPTMEQAFASIISTNSV